MSFRSIDPDKATRITNAISDAYIVGALEAKYQSTKRASEWLQQRSLELRDQATEADRAVQTFKAENNIVGTSRGLMSEQQLSDVTTQLIQARAATAEAKARLDRIDAVSDKDLAQPTVTDALSNTVITRLRAQYLDLAAQYADWSNKYGKNHQASINLASRMDETRKSIADEVRRIADPYRSEYEIAKSRESSLESNMNSLVNQAGTSGQAQVKLRNLESAADTYRNLYNTFLDKLQQATQKESFPISEARVISTATKPDKKSSPKTLLFLIGGIVGACASAPAPPSRGSFSTTSFAHRPISRMNSASSALAPCPISARTDQAYRRRGLLVMATDKDAARQQPSLSSYVVDRPFSRFAETLRNIKVSIDVTRLTRDVKIDRHRVVAPQGGKDHDCRQSRPPDRADRAPHALDRRRSPHPLPDAGTRSQCQDRSAGGAAGSAGTRPARPAQQGDRSRLPALFRCFPHDQLGRCHGFEGDG